MRTKILSTICLTIICVLLITGCQRLQELVRDTTESEDPVYKYEYTQAYARIMDPCGSSLLVDKNLAVTSINGNTYRFDDDIPEKDRLEYINAQEMLLTLLDENGICTEGYDFYILKNITGRAVHGDMSLFMDISRKRTFYQVDLTLQTILGEYTNYGYIYALSNEIAQQLNWETDAYFRYETTMFQDNFALLNMVYPCFSEYYFSQEIINGCKAFSRDVLSQMENVFAGEATYISTIESYARENGLEFDPTYLGFAFGGDSCPLKIKTTFLEIFLASDYEGSITLTEQSIADDPMFGLESMINFWEYADKDISDVCFSFGYTSDELVPTYVQPISRKLNGGGDMGGYFEPSGNKGKITLADIYTITHEYTHYVDYRTDDDPSNDINWCKEVLACYYGKNMAYAERVARANSGYENIWTFDDLSNAIKRDFNDTEDEILFQSIMTAISDNPKYETISAYNGRLSYGAYFVETYGEDIFIRCMTTPSVAIQLIGCKIESTVDDWCIWLEQFNPYE